MTPEQALNPNQALWEKGDFTQIAAFMRDSGEAFVATLGVDPSMRVLDLGCGDGTTAVPLAKLGAEVVGIDIAENLVEAGNRRARRMGLENLHFLSGDACDLAGVADDAFDLTLSCFGAMFAPRPFDVAREMVRVTRPGGRIVMANWIPDDPTSFVSQLLKISASYLPAPPEGFVSPVTWGVEEHVVERFGQAGIPADRISTTPDVLRFVAPERTPAQFIAIFAEFYGPTMNAVEAARADGKEQELRERLVGLAEEHNTSAAGGTVIGATCLRVSVSV